MIVENHALWGEEPTEEYPATFTYLGAEPLPDKPNGRRPAVIICGGGAFTHIAPHEQDPVAFAFLDHGYQAFVLNYVTSGTGDVSFPHPRQILPRWSPRFVRMPTSGMSIPSACALWAFLRAV